MPATRPSIGRPPSSKKCCIVQQAGLAGNSNHARKKSAEYDMGILRELSRAEEEATNELVQMFRVESEDGLPVSIDLWQHVDLEEGDRRAFLESMLQACASDSVPAFIDKCLERTSELDARMSEAISAARPAIPLATDRRRCIMQLDRPAWRATASLKRCSLSMGILREL